jgi:hypothetical protein
MEKPKADLMDLMPEIVVNNPVWADMIQAFIQVMETNVDGPIDQLQTVRHINRYTEDEYLKYTARLIGFDVSQDILDRSSANLLKLVTQLPHYPDYNGPDLFIKFEELILNAKISMEHLYTEDYVNFYPEPGGGLLKLGHGNWFKTTHINLNIELRDSSVVLSTGDLLYQRVRDIFYNFCPISLVINALYLVVTFDIVDWVGGKAFGIETRIDETSSFAHITLE